MNRWHIITCEYPPQIGGVSDYTRLLAAELRHAGDEVEVWAPALGSDKQEHLHRTLGAFDPADLHATDEALDQFPAPRKLLVQWVPHGYGRRGINLGFCRWIAARAGRGDRVHLMVHEPYLEPAQPSWKLRFASLVQRRMIRTLLHASHRVFISIPAWEHYLRPYTPPPMRFEWLPIPATVPVVADAKASTEVRTQLGKDALVLGHLGTYSAEMTHILQPAITKVLRDAPNSVALLLGNNGDAYAASLKSDSPDLAARLQGPGRLDNAVLSHYISACDLMLQPFPDGLSSRRTSLMNVLSHGVAVVSNVGHLTESLWAESNSVALASTSEPTQLAALCEKLLRDHETRAALAQAGLTLYRSRFDWPAIISTLRSSVNSPLSTAARSSSNQ